MKGVSEGIEDSLEGDKGIKVKEIKEKFEKRIGKETFYGALG